MRISRRDFLKYAAASAAALSLSQSDLFHLEQALADESLPPVIWLSGSSCTGCSVSLMNAVSPTTIDDVLLNYISLRYHTTLMTAAGGDAVVQAIGAAAGGGHVLVVEGAIPSGPYCYVWDSDQGPVTMEEAVRSLAENAAAVIAVGTCAAYGGIPATYAGAGARGVGDFLGQPVINLPGCPAHPEWIVGSLVKLLTSQPIDLDKSGRPLAYYPNQAIHTRCPRKGGSKAECFGQDGLCMNLLGCKGPDTNASCDLLGWNNGPNYCIGVNGLCIGCTEPDFPAFPLHGSGKSGHGHGKHA